MGESLSIEKIKTVIIVILSLVIVFGGAYVSSIIRDLKSNCSEPEENLLAFKNINIDEYISLIKGDKLSLIYIGRDDCTYANAQNVVFEELLENYDIEINYLDLNALDSEGIEILYTSYQPFLDDGISTPTIMLVQNKEVKIYQKGYLSIESLTELLKENNFIG